GPLLFFRTRSIRDFSTLMILPRMGRMAWNFGSRPPLAEPPAESPSTTYSSHTEGSPDWQSDSFPGRPELPDRPLRVSSRAWRAAIRARAAWVALMTTALASPGLR